MLHALQEAIEPPIPLQQIVGHWNQLEMDLREPSRKRRPQIEIL
jgi:hypothetical protein